MLFMGLFWIGLIVALIWGVGRPFRASAALRASSRMMK